MPRSANVTNTGWPIARGTARRPARWTASKLAAGVLRRQSRQFDRVHLEAQRREMIAGRGGCRPARSIRARSTSGRMGRCADRRRDDARLGNIHLVQQQSARRPAAPVDAIAAGKIVLPQFSGVGVQFLESSRFNSRGGWPGSITSGLQ